MNKVINTENLKLLFLSESEAEIRDAFPELMDIDIVAPFD